MIRIRPVKTTDIEGLLRCAAVAGLGMTHVPNNRDYLEKLIQTSIDSFAAAVESPGSEKYVFVLEDVKSLAIGGTCAIYAKTGSTLPAYFYQVEQMLPLSDRLPVPKDNRLLRQLASINGPTEIGGLILLPEFRKEGLGKILSFSRFLFMANHANRFYPNVMANMRGIIENGESVFWNGFGRKFYDADLTFVMQRRTKKEIFAADIFPPYAICAALLSEVTQKAIGEVHKDTIPALKMLQSENFAYENIIDPFDGGPVVTAPLKEIRTVKKHMKVTVKEIVTDRHATQKFLIANNSIDFRATHGELTPLPDGQANISKDVADALEIGVGDVVRYIKIEQS